MESIPGIIGWKQRHFSCHCPHSHPNTQFTTQDLHAIANLRCDFAHPVVHLASAQRYLIVWPGRYWRCNIHPHCFDLARKNIYLKAGHIRLGGYRIFENITTKKGGVRSPCHSYATLKKGPGCTNWRLPLLQQLLKDDGRATQYQSAAFLPNFFLCLRCKDQPRQMPNASKWRLILIGESPLLFSCPPFPHSHLFLVPLFSSSWCASVFVERANVSANQMIRSIAPSRRERVGLPLHWPKWQTVFVQIKKCICCVRKDLLLSSIITDSQSPPVPFQAQ